MEYTKDFHIESLIDVMNFYHYMIYEKQLIIHPDKPIEENEDKVHPERTITASMAEMYNRLLEESFEFCDKNKIDVYHIAYDVLYNYLMDNNKK